MGLRALRSEVRSMTVTFEKAMLQAVLDSQSLIGTLGSLGFSGLSNALLQNQQSLDNSSSAVDSTFDTARKLETWNLPTLGSTSNPSVAIYKAYQAWNQATELSVVKQVVWSGFSDIIQNVLRDDISASSLWNHLGGLAILTELNDAVDVVNSTELEQLLETFSSRTHWMKSGR